MAEGAASREGSAPPEAAGSEDDPRVGPDAISGDCVAAAPGGRWRDRRSGVALPGAAGPPADSEAALLEAARATPRRSSIIKPHPSSCRFLSSFHLGLASCLRFHLGFMTSV
ncbi:hypothetical protein FD755_007005 [Muntiacus reevesi]|uniref:Uncharacterized protein n=2 Tax=Muntiacus TaxID=9885 RepID=A0A5J5MIF4_MUNRE|nr:hypothetical protein FD754_009963 [Muntiacus muntjak]KAB0379221.1 hypothetical protein FD755_007005 [Muntiacus reevesi]